MVTVCLRTCRACPSPASAQVSHYMAVGCISARDAGKKFSCDVIFCQVLAGMRRKVLKSLEILQEILARAEESANYNGVAHRLLWRELHRLNAIRSRIRCNSHGAGSHGKAR